MDQNKMSTRELIALSVSAIIVAGTVIYWLVQVNGVRKMFELAAGG